MNILLMIIIAVVCFGAGWFTGIKNIDQLEGLLDNTEKAIDYIENIESPDTNMMNSILNQNRDTNVLLNIQTLLDLEQDNIENAKKRLITGLAIDYLDIKEDEAHELRSLESKNIIEKIETLAKDHESFGQVIQESGWVE